MSGHESYKKRVENDIAETLRFKNCQPILFIGSGFSQRYAHLPNWHQLLSEMAEICPSIEKDYAYYAQTIKNPVQIGTFFAERFQDWAWGEGRDEFPSRLFEKEVHGDAYIKHAICQHLTDLLEDFAEDKLPKSLYGEIAAIKAIKPHAIITTNYDDLCERIFPEYTPIVGQQIIQGDNFNYGEIFKIHGDLKDSETLILTENDYRQFIGKKKYLVAKLLTLFTEHPLVFVGYSANDPNIKLILSDIDEILSPVGQLIPNIYLVQWKQDASGDGQLPYETLIPIDENKSVRVKNITTHDFKWVYEAFSSDAPLEQINPKLLRALMARTYRMIRTDIPKRTIEVDFRILENALQSEEGIPSLFGLASIVKGTDLNAGFPNTMTMVSDKLKSKNHIVINLLKKIKAEKGIDIKGSDNRYHCAIRTGKSEKSVTHKYSDALVELLERVMAEDPYTVEL